jgi:hypothetical protein
MKAKCPEEPNEVDRAVVKCYNCDGIGHRVRDCKFNSLIYMFPKVADQECERPKPAP